MICWQIKKMPKKKVGSVHTAKNGAKYKIMANGSARFISGATKEKKAWPEQRTERHERERRRAED